MNRVEVKRRDNSEIKRVLTVKRILKWLKSWINVDFEALKLETRISIPSGHQLLSIGRFAEYLLASGAFVVQTCPDASWILKLWLLKAFGTYKFTGRAWTFLHNWFKCSTRPYSTWACSAEQNRYHVFKSLCVLIFVFIAGCCGKYNSRNSLTFVVF